VRLIGFGGTAKKRIIADVDGMEPQLRLQDKCGTFKMQNTGERTGFVYIEALGKDAHEASGVTVKPNHFLLPKLSRSIEVVTVQITSEDMWKKIKSGKEEIRLAIYFGVERQRLRFARYYSLQGKKPPINPDIGIDFTSLQFAGESADMATMDKKYLSRDDVTLFENNLQVTNVNLVPPPSANATTSRMFGTSINGQDQQKICVPPVLFDKGDPICFDDDEKTSAITTMFTTKHWSNVRY